VLNGITDCVGNSLINGTAPFALPEAPAPNDVVINEVLFNEPILVVLILLNCTTEVKKQLI
jgi:hypothetical protein